MTGAATHRTTGLAAEPDRRAPVLLSVNVGMPKDVPWHGQTVHTGVWKHPVTGPRMVRRLNIDGDGQGDTARPRRRAAGRAGLPDRLLPVLAAALRPRRLRATASSGRTSPSTACPTTRCASATGTASARPSSRSPSRGSPATGWACGWVSPSCPRCWSATTGPASTCASSPKGHIQAGDPIVKTRTGPPRAHRGRHRRAALPSRPRPRQAPRRDPDPGAEPRLAGVVPRAAGSRRATPEHGRPHRPPRPSRPGPGSGRCA